MKKGEFQKEMYCCPLLHIMILLFDLMIVYNIFFVSSSRYKIINFGYQINFSAIYKFDIESLMIHHKKYLSDSFSEPFEFCYPYIKYRTYSTPRDLCITSMFYKNKRLQMNLFSVRKSGCKASIIFMTEPNHNFTNDLLILMKAFEVQIIEGTIVNQNYQRHTDFYRDSFLYEFLKYHSNDYDRVFFYDSFDVFFEKDPFKYFTEEKMYFFEESSIPIINNSCNRIWVQECYGTKGLELVGKYHIICSGTIASGSARLFLKFLTLFTSTPSYKNKNCTVDQGQLGYGIHSGLFAKNGINLVVVPNDNSPIATIKNGPVKIVPFDLDLAYSEYNQDSDFYFIYYFNHFSLQKLSYYNKHNESINNDKVDQTNREMFLKKIDLVKEISNIKNQTENHQQKLISMIKNNKKSYLKNKNHSMVLINGYQNEVIHQYNRRPYLQKSLEAKCQYSVYIEMNKEKVKSKDIPKEKYMVK